MRLIPRFFWRRCHRPGISPDPQVSGRYLHYPIFDALRHHVLFPGLLRRTIGEVRRLLATERPGVDVRSRVAGLVDASARDVARDLARDAASGPRMTQIYCKSAAGGATYQVAVMPVLMKVKICFSPCDQAASPRRTSMS
jgi:hypothetical protein